MDGKLWCMAQTVTIRQCCRSASRSPTLSVAEYSRAVPWHATCDACSVASPALPAQNKSGYRRSPNGMQNSRSRGARSFLKTAPVADATCDPAPNSTQARQERLAAPSSGHQAGCSSTAHERSCKRSEAWQPVQPRTEQQRLVQTLPTANVSQQQSKVHDREDSARQESWHANRRRPGETVIVDALLTEVRACSSRWRGAPKLLWLPRPPCLKSQALGHHTSASTLTLTLYRGGFSTANHVVGKRALYGSTLSKRNWHVQVKSLKQQIADRKHRELLLELRSLELERERDSMRALWEAEKERQTTMHKAMADALGAMGLQQHLS